MTATSPSAIGVFPIETLIDGFSAEFVRYAGGALRRRSELALSPTLLKAIEYTLFLPAKRLRPMLVLEVCRALRGSAESAMPGALAVELIHTYSLIHDDLPCMDNDDLRRGQPANHKVYGEGMALLAGDALQALAFDVLAEAEELSETSRLRSIQALNRGAGVSGMVLGQALDIVNSVESGSGSEGETLVRRIHRYKTAALIGAACELGACAAAGSVREAEEARKFGILLGEAFQIVDDILDVEGGADLGKPIGSDTHLGKLTMVSVLGLTDAKRRAEEKIAELHEWIKDRYLSTPTVKEIVEYVLRRTR